MGNHLSSDKFEQNWIYQSNFLQWKKDVQAILSHTIIRRWVHPCPVMLSYCVLSLFLPWLAWSSYSFCWENFDWLYTFVFFTSWCVFKKHCWLEFSLMRLVGLEKMAFFFQVKSSTCYTVVLGQQQGFHSFSHNFKRFLSQRKHQTLSSGGLL